MKTRFILFLLLFFSINVSSQITWSHSVSKAKKYAKKNDKFILWYFTADWCPPCKRMNFRVWDNPDLEMFNQYFSFLKYDLTGGFSNPYFKIKSIPRIVITDSYGKELFQFCGTETINFYMTMYKSFSGDVKTLNTAYKLYKKNKRDPEILLALAKEYQLLSKKPVKGPIYNKFIELSDKYLYKAKKYAKKKKITKLEENARKEILMNLYNSRRYKEFVEKMNETEFKDKGNRHILLMCKIKSCVKLHIYKQAQKHYDLLLFDNPSEEVISQLQKDKVIFDKKL